MRSKIKDEERQDVASTSAATNSTSILGGDKKNTTNDDNDDDCDDDFTKVIMGGSIRGLLLFWIKKISLKAILKKKAFLTIGGTAEGGHGSDLVAKKSTSSISHSRSIYGRPVWMCASFAGPTF